MPALLLMLAVLIGIGLIGLLLAGGRGAPARDDGRTVVLRHSPVLRWFSILAVFGGCAGFGLSTALYPPKDPIIQWANIAGVVMLGTFGMVLLWESFKWQLIITPSGLTCRSPWTGGRTLPWSEIESVKYSRLNSWYIVRSHDGKSFRLSIIVPGVKRFLEMCHAAGIDTSPPK
jgi:hypothetical protein